MSLGTSNARQSVRVAREASLPAAAATGNRQPATGRSHPAPSRTEYPPRRPLTLADSSKNARATPRRRLRLVHSPRSGPYCSPFLAAPVSAALHCQSTAVLRNLLCPANSLALFVGDSLLPVLIDGNNLLHAARDVDDPDRAPGRLALCQILSEWAQRARQRTQIVFDGPKPTGGLAEQIDAGVVQVQYSGPFSADAVLVEMIAKHSAARTLLVVSSDREIQRAAKRHLARTSRADNFWRSVRAMLAQPPKMRADEPGEKRRGLKAADTEQWLREFGLEDPAD